MPETVIFQNAPPYVSRGKSGRFAKKEGYKKKPKPRKNNKNTPKYVARNKSGRFVPKRKMGLPIKGLVLLLFTILVLIAFYFSILRDLPSPVGLTTREIPQTTKIYDRNGKLIYNIYSSQNRSLVTFDEIPQNLRNATISIEDKEFYKHGAIDFFGGIVRAVKDMALYHKLQGGSTLTQQLIKSALLTPERTVPRKIKEIILAFWTEKLYSKNQILTMYLNQVPYGGAMYGVQSASEGYFGKNVKDLDLAESALLAGLPAAPTQYSPFGAHPELSISRAHEVLAHMVEQRYITSAQAEEAKNEKIVFRPQTTDIKAPHFSLWVKEQLVQKYGLKAVEQGGLRVVTTLDLPLQDFAQNAIATEVAHQKNLKVGNGSALITKPGTGEILAMVGSKDYFASDSGNVNVTLSNRSPGSSIKPLNYALGIETRKITAGTPLIDASTCFTYAGQPKAYCPGNYDGRFHGPSQVRFALGNSYNIPAVKVLSLNGLDTFIATASAMGITTLTEQNRYGLSLTLGGGEVKMVDMATAFSTFANAGIQKNLSSILEVEDNKGRVIESYDTHKENVQEASASGKRIFSPETSYIISHILLDDVARQATFGTGSPLAVNGVSVKTGTAELKTDNWTIGYTPDILVAVWVGNNDNSPMSPYVESGSSGAAPIWRKLMLKALNNKPARWPEIPKDVVGLSVCSLSGMLPGNDCPTRFEYFLKGTEPKEPDNIWNKKTKIYVLKGSNKQPTDQEIQSGKYKPEELEEQDHTLLSDSFTKNFCVDCPL